MDSIVHYFRQFFDYEQDCHRKVISALSVAPEGVRNSEFYQKVVDIIGHVIAVRMVWYSRIADPSLCPETNVPKGLHLSDLEEQVVPMHSIWRDYLKRLDSAELVRVVNYKTFKGSPASNRVDELLIQLHGHSIYHCGQAALWMRQSGAEPAATDYILWAHQARA